MTAPKGESRFASLRTLRAERQNEPTEMTEVVADTAEPLSHLIDGRESSDTGEPVQKAKPLPVEAKLSKTPQAVTPPDASLPRRGPGRPPGRRSDPDYTQISAYIPLDLLLAVQDELASERREKRQRTARPVSDLVEELLSQWLIARQSQNSDAVNPERSLKGLQR